MEIYYYKAKDSVGKSVDGIVNANSLDEASAILVGKKLTIADVTLVSVLVNPFKFIFEEKFRKSIPNVTRWFESICELPAFAKVWGKIRLCIKEFEPYHGVSTTCPHEKQPEKAEKQAEEPRE